MYSINVSLIAFALIFAGALLGIYLRRVLPDEHFSADAKVVIRLSTGFVVTMTGLVLGMLVSSAKGSYDAQKTLVSQVSMKILLLDRSLAAYGPETKKGRSILRDSVQATFHRFWPQEAFADVDLEPSYALDKVEGELRTLEPKNEIQVSAKREAIVTLGELRESGWLLFVQSESNSLSIPLLVVLVSCSDVRVARHCSLGRHRLNGQGRSSASIAVSAFETRIGCLNRFPCSENH